MVRKMLKKKDSKRIDVERAINTPAEDNSSLPIVGIGASAGGLETIEKLFHHMPSDTGMAFVIITHLDRTHTSIMSELIQKFTDMQVLSIKDGVKVQPNTVYVIPPNANVALSEGTLRLVKQEKVHYANLPINFFYESLAKEKGEKAIAIILSGSGSDGTLGLKMLKTQGGVVIVQDPLTAKYDGMPHSAVATGIADYILPIEEIPAQLIKCLHYGKLKEGKISLELQQVFMVLRMQTGHDFASYKLNTIYRRIQKQMSIHHISNLSDYVKFLQTNPQEINSLFKDLLIGVTRFFRDPEAFEVLKNDILPKLLKHTPDNYCIRVWVPGCSTGEEVYSIAIIIREFLYAIKTNYRVQIFGTDIDYHAIDFARMGLYPEILIKDIEPTRLKQFFNKEKNGYRIKTEIRETVVFGVQNIIKDPPFTKLDLICCRNLLIYFNTELQKKILPIFHYSLKPKGLLFLGTSESVSGYDDLFRLIAKKWKIFERKDTDSYRYAGFNFTSAPGVELIKNNSGNNPLNTINESNEAIKNFLIDNYVPFCLIVNKKDDIVYVHGKTSFALGRNTNKENKNILELIHPKAKTELETALRKVTLTQRPIILNGLSFKKTKTSYSIVNIAITPITKNKPLDGLLYITQIKPISSTLVKTVNDKQPAANRLNKKIQDFQKELQHTKENLNATIEELQASNEELQSTNEELQSTNEEIETSKEELQSLNEELVSVNSELQTKIDQYTSISDDMNNLFNSTEIAAIFLDNDFHIKRFTPKVQELIHLIQSDIGRSLGDFATNIKHANLIEQAKEVLTTLIPKSFMVRSKNANHYLVRILPYRTLSNVIDGVIIIFDDITKHKKAEKKLTELNNALNDALTFTNSILDTISEPMLVLNDKLKIVKANRSFLKLFKVNSEDVVDKLLYSISNGQWDVPDLRVNLEKVIKKDVALKKFIIEHEFPIIGYKKLTLNALRIFRDELGTNALLLVIREE